MTVFCPGPIEWKAGKINVLDTPGSSTPVSLGALRAEGAILVAAANSAMEWA